MIAASEVDEAPVSRRDRVVRPGASANRSDDRAVGGLEDVPDAARTVLAARHVQPAGVRTYSTGVDAAVQMDRPDDAFGEQVVGQHRAVAVATAVAAVGDEEHVRGRRPGRPHQHVTHTIRPQAAPERAPQNDAPGYHLSPAPRRSRS